MPAFTMPAADSRLAIHAPTGAELYASLATCPLYATARVIAPRRNLVRARRSFYLGFVIQEQRFANGQDVRTLPAEILTWALAELRAVYPSVEEAAGLTAAEVAELVRELAERKAARK